MGLKNGYFDGKIVYMVTVRVVVVRVVRVRNTQSSIGHGSPGMGFVSLYKGAPYHRLSEGGRYLVPRTRWRGNKGILGLEPVI